ncbi:ATP-binding protein [Vibrio sp. Of7-15]|uniref:ATP-binding protein n=1 Tax=Vibrio sp. Of7-15 TaxID=2724879 RepID=UPI001EF39B30|nr:ATP-binding protein [Vibrio sp. Of7-15]MCG7499811.1 ATP-binding protein [Vibrio sp. Of7-15]
MDLVKQHFAKHYESSLEVSRHVSDDLTTFLNQSGVGSEVIEQLELCLVEIVNNAYEHAYLLDDGKPIEVDATVCENAEVIIDVANYGIPMTDDEFQSAVNKEVVIPDPDDPSSWSISGRGFMIVTQLSDGLEYFQEGTKSTFRLSRNVAQ